MRAAEQLGALAHGDEAEPAPRSAGSMPVAMILDFQLDQRSVSIAAAPRRASAPECRATLLSASCSTR